MQLLQFLYQLAVSRLFAIMLDSFMYQLAVSRLFAIMLDSFMYQLAVSRLFAIMLHSFCISLQSAGSLLLCCTVSVSACSQQALCYYAGQFHVSACSQQALCYCAAQFHVSACSQQALCYYAKNTDEQLGNVKDIHQSDCTHCRWFDKSLLTFWNCYLTLISIYSIF